MNDKKVAVIICALIAVCAVIYMGWPSSHNTGEAPKTPTSGLSKQRVKNTREPSKTAVSRLPRQRVQSDSEPDYTTTVQQQPRDIIRPISRPAPTTIDENASAKAQELQTQALEKRMLEFKEKYQWDEPATMNMAEHLLNLIPKQFRDSGITAMINNFDEAQQLGNAGAVDEAMVLQSVEKIMPDEYKPRLQAIIEKFKAEHANDRR
jgi:murein L,D-transpeptidase YcbB/YkuD